MATVDAPSANTGIASAKSAEVITPSDTVGFSRTCLGIYVGVTGNVTALLTDESVVTFVGVPAGAILPVQANRVNATDTTATSLVALLN